MVCQDGARLARVGSQTEAITVARLDAVCTKWIITALGRLEGSACDLTAFN